MPLFSQSVKYPAIVNMNQKTFFMNQEKTTTYHLTDISKVLIIGIILTVLSSIFSPDTLFYLVGGALAIYTTSQMFACSIMLLFVFLEIVTSSYKRKRIIPETTKRFLGVMKELFVEKREVRKKGVEEVIERGWRAQVVKDNYPW